MKGALLLDVVVGEGAAVLELLAGEDQALLVRRDALLVLDLRLDVVDRVARLDLEGDRLARQGLDEAVVIALGFVSLMMRHRARGAAVVFADSHLHCKDCKLLFA